MTMLLPLTPGERRLVRRVAKGLIDIAELAMPDTYFATDSRVKDTRWLLALTKARVPAVPRRTR